MELSLPAALSTGPLIVGLTMGLSSSLHCLAMCGGIAASLAAAAPAHVRKDRLKLATHMLGYHGGRIASYALAGLLAGALGGGLVATISQTDGYAILRWLAAATLMAIGFSTAGWIPVPAGVERLTWPIWARIQPIGRQFAPGQNSANSFLYGALWGWLPCGMVYAALFYAVMTGSGVMGAAAMAAFGLGTLPMLLGIGLFAAKLRPGPRAAPLVKQLLGGLLILIAVLSIVQPAALGPICATPPS
ncbi:MAG: sulfite exporter TauE/SafE family protein [Geminicoccaceae bacterium]